MRYFALLFLCLPILGASFKLEVTEEEGKVITEIITTIYKNNVISLGFKQGHLRKLGDKLHHVNPLQFLGYIFSDPTLSKYMVSIAKSSFKFNGIVDGLAPELKKMKQGKALGEELPSFAVFIKVSPDPLEKEVKENDWRGFVRAIIAEQKSQQSTDPPKAEK